MTADGMRVLIAGGGTGGHLYPGIALAEEIKSRPGGEVLFVGAQRGLEAKVIPAEGYPLELLEVSGIKRTGMRGLVKGLVKLPRALALSRDILKRNDPSVVVGVGGYASGPMVLMASLMGFPTAIQEQNSHPGFTNKVLRRFVDRVFIAFDDARKQLGKKKTTLTGNPVRRKFIDGAQRPHAAAAGRLVVVGGSQGARAINDLVAGMTPLLMERGELPPVLHQSGQSDYDRVRRRYDVLRVGERVELRPYIEDMYEALSTAALVISRAGALTLAELAIVGCPAILIPLPTASDDHQTSNARSFERAGAAVLMPQRETVSDDLADLVAELMADVPRRQKMSAAMRELGRPQAAREIVDQLTELANDG
ncbi:MAG TPA: undecaprenyldiphospho-muramoylpentapeptide beta-N-acetylglucosaminyltransferase [Polyangia bacterium]|jgi:UDP-N-acetylglucosamine--N-acetylmuramyl-(pentapeptide) pyrophosphoryl-undecaprenol N-acetylglucosamine transferase|nr:undecaprenyldiphospho-muramoylpentapeptide beta-N-acetylglucosaminyltransferase [Polyangia bacterium]